MIEHQQRKSAARHDNETIFSCSLIKIIHLVSGQCRDSHLCQQDYLGSVLLQEAGPLLQQPVRCDPASVDHIRPGQDHDCQQDLKTETRGERTVSQFELMWFKLRSVVRF